MQLKEEKVFFPESQTGGYYTSPFSSFSSIDPTRFEKQIELVQPKATPHTVFPRPKTPYMEIFVLAEICVSKHRIGARFYDPELGVWLTPDPAGQFSDPYGYGGDPVNFVDPNGEELITILVIAGITAYGIYEGGRMANDGEINPLKWDYEDPDTYIGMGTGAVGGLAGGVLCVETGGAVCGVASYSNGQFNVKGGGYAGGHVYGGEFAWNHRTGYVGARGLVASYAPFSAGGLEIQGNYKTNEFQIRGIYYGHGVYVPPSNIYRTRKDGFGFNFKAHGRLDFKGGGCGGPAHHGRNQIGGNGRNAPPNLEAEIFRIVVASVVI